MHNYEQCRLFFEKLSEYIDHELDQSSCDAIEKHLQQCPPCQTCLATLKQTISLCHKMKSADVPVDFSERLQAMIRQKCY